MPHKKYHPTGTLAQRVLLVSILLLVIPLFLQSLYLYRQEYDEKLEDIEQTLSVFARERSHFIEQIIAIQWQSLKDRPSNATAQDVKRIPVPKGTKDFFVIGSTTHDAILIGKKESPSTAIAVAVPFAKLIQDLGTSYPVRLALIDGRGNVLAENRSISSDADLIKVQDVIEGTDLRLELTIPKEMIRDLHLRSYYFRFATLVFFVGIIGGFAVYLLTRRIAKPLRNLCKTMERVSQGAIHARYPHDRMGFEINALGKQFNDTMDSLLHHMNVAEKEKTARQKLAEELRIGHEIQSKLFPTHIAELSNVDMATAYFPAAQVNGDFYDLFWLDDGTLLISMCDTAGHGISACLFSLGLRSMMRSFAKTNHKLSEIVRQTNDLFWFDAHETAMFATLWSGIFNPKTKKLTYCSQGHPAALLKRENKVQALWTNGIALGAQKVDVVDTDTIGLRAGDVLLLYTDGVIETHNSDHLLYGKERLERFLLQIGHETAQQIADQLIASLKEFQGNALQHDDITFVVIRIFS